MASVASVRVRSSSNVIENKLFILHRQRIKIISQEMAFRLSMLILDESVLFDLKTGSRLKRLDNQVSTRF